MNEQDKQAFEAALNYAKAQNDMAHVERFDVCDFRTGWNAALEYARQQEPVKGVVLSSDGPSLVKRGTERDYIARNGGSLLYTTPPAQPTYAEQCQAEAWLAVTNTLNELMPGWADKADSGMEAACTAIRELAQPVQPEKKMLVCCPQCKLVFDGKSNRINSAAQPVQPAVNEQLLGALKHLHHNAKQSGANMGLALDVSEAAIAAAEAQPVQHPDDLAVDKFAAAMKDKLAKAREKGRSGWEQMNPEQLSSMLHEHVYKGDPRDVANFCMFLWNLGQPITAAPPVQNEIARLRAALKKANDQAEHFEREWYLRGDEIEALKAQPVQPAVNEQLLEALKDLLEFHIKSTGITPETIADKEKFEAFMKYVESREKEVREQAEAAIRAAEAAKGGV